MNSLSRLPTPSWDLDSWEQYEAAKQEYTNLLERRPPMQSLGTKSQNVASLLTSDKGMEFTVARDSGKLQAAKREHVATTPLRSFLPRPA